MTSGARITADDVSYVADVLTIAAILIGGLAVAKYLPTMRRRAARRRLSALAVNLAKGFFSATLGHEPGMELDLTADERLELGAGEGAAWDRGGPSCRCVWIHDDYYVTALVNPGGRVLAYWVTARTRHLAWRLPRTSQEMFDRSRMISAIGRRMKRQWRWRLTVRYGRMRLGKSKLVEAPAADSVYAVYGPDAFLYAECHTFFERSGYLCHHFGVSTAGFVDARSFVAPVPDGVVEYAFPFVDSALADETHHFRSSTRANTYGASVIVDGAPRLALLKMLGPPAWLLPPSI